MQYIVCRYLLNEAAAGHMEQQVAITVRVTAFTQTKGVLRHDDVYERDDRVANGQSLDPVVLDVT